MSNRKIEVISFDASDTLLRPASSVGEVYASVATKHGINVESTLLENTFTKAKSALEEQDKHSDRGMNWWRKVVEHTFESLGYETSQFDDFDSFFQDLYDQFGRGLSWTLHADASPALEALRNEQVKLAVFSNFDRRLYNILERLGASKFFEQVVCSEDIGLSKPDPAAFIALCNKLGFPPTHVLHVGDSYENDYRAAQRAGLKALLLNRSSAGQPGKEESTIRSLEEVVSFI
jgi:putative hydrolase of the HAD superfamily